MRRQKLDLKTPYPHPSLLARLNFTPGSLSPSHTVLQGEREWGRQSVHLTLPLMLLCPQREDSLHFSPSPVSGPTGDTSASHGPLLLMNCSRTSPLHSILSSVGIPAAVWTPLHGAPSPSCRNLLLCRISFWGARDQKLL